MPTRIEQLGAASGGNPTTAADLTESISYSGTLTAGSYTRADILALMAGATALISFSATCASGTMDFTQSGSVDNLEAGSVIDRPYAEGLSINDFTLNVDAGSTAYVEARGLA